MPAAETGWRRGVAAAGDLSGCVAVDAMGGDHAPDAIVAGAVEAASSGTQVLLVGDTHAVEAALGGVAPHRRPGIVDAGATLDLTDPARTAVPPGHRSWPHAWSSDACAACAARPWPR